jgi:hypothetical protein
MRQKGHILTGPGRACRIAAINPRLTIPAIRHECNASRQQSSKVDRTFS